jgi:energy-coupling factor transporter ATP-binding protein EcfA2
MQCYAVRAGKGKNTMLTTLHIQRLKSWADTGPIRLAPLTGFFGPNSSGKTTLLQLLLLLKQTVESPDRLHILQTGDSRSSVDMGTYEDMAHQHRLPTTLSYALGWTPHPQLMLAETPGVPIPQPTTMEYAATIRIAPQHKVSLASFQYRLATATHSCSVGMAQQPDDASSYRLTTENWNIQPQPDRSTALPRPIKSYGFPDQISRAYQHVTVLSDLVLAFEQVFSNLLYLGPLRDYPRRISPWSGDAPQDVGLRGERAISALLATRFARPSPDGNGSDPHRVEQTIAAWLKQLNMIASFSVEPIAPHRTEYEVRVKRTPHSPAVLLTDVGFGVSQLLPVLVLCYYAPRGATIILEQPETHLHPSVQAGLADVFIDAIQTRGIQIIVESHSEHLLRRLQRRIAEATFAQEHTALYFCATDDAGTSQLTTLELDPFGNIHNWPADFFGDEPGETIAMAEAEMQRRQAGE